VTPRNIANPTARVGRTGRERGHWQRAGTRRYAGQTSDGS